MPIASKKYVEKVGKKEAGKHPIGSGPFKFVEHEPGNYIKFEALEHHWRQTPYIKTLIIKKVPEPATRVAMLKAGEAELIEVKHESIKEIKAAEGVKIKGIPNGCQSYMCLLGQYLPKRPGYDPTVPYALPDKERARKVRKALSLAIKRQEIIDYVLYGYGTVEDCAVIYWWPGDEGWNSEWEVDGYDLKRAKQLLAEAGYSNPKELVITVDTVRHPGRPYGGDIAEAVGMQWSELVTVNMRHSEWSNFYAGVANREQAGVTWCYAAPWAIHPIVVLWGTSHTKTRSMYTAEYPHLDKLMDAVMDETDPQKRTVLSRELGDYLYSNMFAIPIGYTDIIFGISDKLEWPVGPPCGSYITNTEYMRLLK
jgi:ABC-type transport system substrate-binding protein